MNAIIPLLLCSGGNMRGMLPLVLLWAMSQGAGGAPGGMITVGRGKRKKKVARKKVTIIPKKALRKLKAKASRGASPGPASRTPTPDAEPNAAPADEAPIDEVIDVPGESGPEQEAFGGDESAEEPME